MNSIQKYEMPDVTEIQRIAKIMVASQYFPTQGDVNTAIAQLAVQVLAGAELGMGPFQAVNSLHVIKGKPTMSANSMAAAVKANPKYDYRADISEEGVSIEFFQDGESLGISTFTREDAKKAGTGQMAKFARNMMFARAMSNGVRWYCPDVFAVGVYTSEEMGGEVNEEDLREIEVTDAPVVEVVVIEDSAQLEETAEELFSDDEPILKDDAKLRKQFHATGTKAYGKGWDAKRKELSMALAGVESSNFLTVKQAKQLIDGMSKAAA